MAITAAASLFNNKDGNGQFTALTRKNTKKSDSKSVFDIINKKDPRMRFKNSRDPLYVLFDYMDQQPLEKVAKEFVKDSVFEIMQFVSVVKDKLSV